MNLNNFWDKKDLSENKGNIKRIFFYRICGMGMGACATLLKDYGYDIEGCDKVFFPPMSHYLESQKIKCIDIKDVDAKILNEYDLIVVGNSVGGKSSEARMIEDCGTPFTSFPTLMGEFILKDRCVVGIAGTHGKTTTTYYLTQILKNLGQDPGYFIGGVLNSQNPPSFMGKGKYFVIESDEYDTSYFQKTAKFREYEINHLILTSLEFDHADIYQNLEAIEKEFSTLTPNVEFMVGNSDYESVRKIGESLKFLEYGMNSKAGPFQIVYEKGECQFSLKVNGNQEKFSTKVIGNQNILNLTSAVLWCLEVGFELTKVKEAVKDLKNVKRRQELRGVYQGSPVIDDFAHHPTSVDLTIDSIQRIYPDKKINCVIEPSTSTSRSTAFQQSFIDSFKGASAVIVCDPKIATNAKQFENLDYKKLTNDIGRRWNISTELVTDVDDLIKNIDELCNDDSVLLVMGNRTILGLWESSFVEQLS